MRWESCPEQLFVQHSSSSSEKLRGWMLTAPEQQRDPPRGAGGLCSPCELDLCSDARSRLCQLYATAPPRLHQHYARVLPRRVCSCQAVELGGRSHRKLERK